MDRARRPRALLVAATALLAFVVSAGILPSEAAAATSSDAVLAQQLAGAINRARAARSLNTLSVDTALVTVAKWRSADMARRGYFGHNIPPSGRLVFSELDRRGYCYSLAGENIGWNLAPTGSAATSIHKLFLASPTHRKIELGSWRRMAVGVATGADGKRYWTVLFSRPCG